MKMHGRLETPRTHPFGEHAAQKIAQSVQVNRTPAIKLICIELLKFSQKAVEKKNTKNASIKLVSRHFQQEMMPYCQRILTVAMFPNQVPLMNVKPVSVKLTLITGHMLLVL